MCEEIYGSSQYYLLVAKANGLDDFRNLKPGQENLFSSYRTVIMAITATIKSKSNGEDMELTYPLLSVDTTKEFNKVPMAELKFADGSAAEQEFPYSMMISFCRVKD